MITTTAYDDDHHHRLFSHTVKLQYVSSTYYLVMEHVSLDKWNEKSMKESDYDKVVGMKQEVMRIMNDLWF